MRRRDASSASRADLMRRGRRRRAAERRGAHPRIHASVQL